MGLCRDCKYWERVEYSVWEEEYCGWGECWPGTLLVPSRHGVCSKVVDGYHYDDMNLMKLDALSEPHLVARGDEGCGGYTITTEDFGCILWGEAKCVSNATNVLLAGNV